ncbi:unnamed protein product, partial [Amoebophrya sp. A25]
DLGSRTASSTVTKAFVTDSQLPQQTSKAGPRSGNSQRITSDNGTAMGEDRQSVAGKTIEGATSANGMAATQTGAAAGCGKETARP